MRIFVTGGTGFIGSHFLRAALAADHSVFALRRSGGGARIALEREPEWVPGELSGDHGSVLQGCDALVHFAALGVSPQKAATIDMFQVNVQSSLTLWRQAAESGVRHLVICGSCFEFGLSASEYARIPPHAPLRPVTGYGASKAAATMAGFGLCRETGCRMQVLRPFTVFGEGQHPGNFWPSLRQAALEGRDFPMTLGEQVRDFTPVERVAGAFLRALAEPSAPGCLEERNVGTGRAASLVNFAREWWAEWKARGRLLPGALPYRRDEVMSYLPEL